jgi:hypothetical protein
MLHNDVLAAQDIRHIGCNFVQVVENACLAVRHGLELIGEDLGRLGLGHRRIAREGAGVRLLWHRWGAGSIVVVGRGTVYGVDSTLFIRGEL